MQADLNLLSLLRAYKCFSEVNGKERHFICCALYIVLKGPVFFSEQKWLDEKEQALMAANGHVERLKMEKEKLSEHR